MVTKADLDAALNEWEVARDKAAYQHAAWGALLQNHKDLITSMRANGLNWNKAQAAFDALSEGHSDALVAAWNDMDRKLAAYKEIAARLA